MDLKAQPFAEHLDQYAGRTVPDVYTKEFHHHIEFRVARLAEEKILYTKAMKTYKRNLRRSVVFYGTRKYPAIAMTLNNMGHVAWKQGRLDEALTFYQESLDISVKINGTREHPAIAMTLNNMGNVESDQGRLDEALTFYQESLDIKVKIYGTRQHPDVATTLNNMGNVAWKQGRLDEALALYQESLDIKVKVYGTREHPEVAMTLNNMGAVASDQGRLDEALALYQESLDIKVKLYGTNQREEVAIMLHNMCYISRLLGRPTQALQYANQCLDIYLELYGTREHSSVAGILDEFGWIHFLQSNFAKALQYHTEALDIVTRISNDPTRAQEAEFLIGCGADLIHLGQLDHAQSKLEKSLELLRAIHSTTDDALIAHALCWLGDLRRLQGNGDDALILYNDAIHMVKRLSRPSNPIITPQALHGITVIQRFRKQLDAARQSITQAIDILLERASDHPYLQDLATLSIELDRNSETSAHIGDCSVM
ncbi:uncharacterized protein BJ171DRAFT_443804 [Polychytrium aggregatum]|uniref:uncharacterized protein n=1 Tax=Polychytrium aggregatum TaxID=110093 RepID=UPI0022FF30CD|nr:uncharacterized protein BJ171DRAFT_443804 [Polychytrium aggregatum]KAI9203232.1 hypothetical protein BJ171DRAFT_443804 [Polychytrium aggregatum]